VEFKAIKKYDALKGRFIREIKENDIVHIAATYDQRSAGSTLTFTALDSNTELYIYGVGYSVGGAQELAITVDTATILPVRFGAAGETSIVSEKPIYKADASSTISIVAVSAGSCAGWLFGVREPTFDKVEVA